MRTIFMGADPFSLPSLRRLAEISDLRAVVTQPDRPRGRGMRETINPVKAEALRLGVPVLTPEKLRAPELLQALASCDADVIFVAAYARLIPPAILSMPHWGCINIHPSLLPRHRGPTPVETALLEGDTTTGVTTFFMDEGYDTGDIILQAPYPIEAGDTGGALREKLSAAGADLLEKTYRLLEEGAAPRTPQDRCAGNYTPRYTREDSAVDWHKDGEKIANRIRALFPQPGTFTFHRGKLLKLVRARAVQGAGAPGTILELVKGGGPVVAAGSGAVLLEEVQPEGKRIMSGREFVQGYRPALGESLGERRSIAGEQRGEASQESKEEP